MRCIVHIVNIGAKAFEKVLHPKMERIRSVLNSLRSSVKRGEIFGEVRVELGVAVELPPMDTEKRWTSTFNMIRKAYAVRSVINTVVNRANELLEQNITEAEWKLAETV